MTLINRHLMADAEVCLETGLRFACVSARVLTAAAAHACNSADAPDCVVPIPLKVGGDNGSWHLDLPRHSLATVEFS